MFVLAYLALARHLEQLEQLQTRATLKMKSREYLFSHATDFINNKQ